MKQELTTAQIIAKCLRNEEVAYVFTLPGHANIAMLDEMMNEGIDIKMFHHETIVGHVADGYSRASGKPGVVCLTCAPGAFNTMLSVTTAAMDCSSVVYITGDTPQELAGKSCYEEFDLHGADDEFATMRPMFKRAFKITNPRQTVDVMSQAFNCAMTGKPGPVLVDVPLDLQTAKVEIELDDTKKRRSSYRIPGAPEAVAHAARLIEQAERPVFFFGGGTRKAGATEELLRLVEKTGGVAVSSLIASGSFPTDHPNFAGVIGSYGVKTANDLCHEADLVIAVGTRFEESETSMWLPEYVFDPSHTRFIQIDIDPREIGKNYPVEVGIVGDAKLVAGQLADAVGEPSGDVKATREENLRILRAGRKALKEALEPLCVSDEIPINPRRVVRALENTLPANATVTLDTSWCRVGFIQQTDIRSQEENYMASGILPIGWSATASCGIALARPDRQVVSLTGDGGFLLNNNIVSSAVEHNLPVVWVVLNNCGYNSLGVLSTVYFGKQKGGWYEKDNRPFSPDYAMLARAYGAEGETVTEPDKLEETFRRAFAAGKPYLIDVRISGPASRLVRTAQVTWDYYWERFTKKSAT